MSGYSGKGWIFFFHVLKGTPWSFSHRFLKVILLYIVFCYLLWKAGHLIIEAWIFYFCLKFIFPSRTFTLMTTLSEINTEYYFLFICTYYFNICTLLFFFFGMFHVNSIYWNFITFIQTNSLFLAIWQFKHWHFNWILNIFTEIDLLYNRCTYSSSVVMHYMVLILLLVIFKKF